MEIVWRPCGDPFPLGSTSAIAGIAHRVAQWIQVFTGYFVRESLRAPWASAERLFGWVAQKCGLEAIDSSGFKGVPRRVRTGINAGQAAGDAKPHPARISTGSRRAGRLLAPWGFTCWCGSTLVPALHCTMSAMTSARSSAWAAITSLPWTTQTRSTPESRVTPVTCSPVSAPEQSSMLLRNSAYQPGKHLPLTG